MDETHIRERGISCMNEACEEYQKIKPGHVIKYGQTDKGIQRYRCKTCRKTFTATKGSFLYRLRHSEEDIAECLAMLGEKKSLAAIHRIKGIKEETVCRWIEKKNTLAENSPEAEDRLRPEGAPAHTTREGASPKVRQRKKRPQQEPPAVAAGR